MAATNEDKSKKLQEIIKEFGMKTLFNIMILQKGISYKYRLSFQPPNNASHA